MVDRDGPVLVTGGSGFVAGHVILRLLANGRRVRTTIRSAARQGAVLTTLQRAGAETSGLEFAVADLTADDGWAAAISSCQAVIHVASPFPTREPHDENAVIGPAREGTRRVLAAAAETGVRRVVMTSSFAAIGYSPKPSGEPYDETDWTDPTQSQSAYVKSKTQAERDAWNVAADRDLDLTVINPVGIFGPVINDDLASSIEIVKALLEGRPPILARASFTVVDVRDVADLHLSALATPHAVGQRFLAAAGAPVTLPEIAATLRAHLGSAGRRVPRHTMPDRLVRVAAHAVPALRELASLIGNPKPISAAKATEMLGWQPRSARNTLVDTAHALLDLDVVSR